MRSKCLVTGLAVALVLALPSSLMGASKFKLLHSFGAAGDGTVPYGPLTVDAQGNVYGVTIDGGTGQCSDYGCGTVFELIPQGGGSWQEVVLYSFAGGRQGSAPWGGLTIDSSGDIYGTLHGGNTIGEGIFELSPHQGGWKKRFIYRKFAGPGLLMDDSGNLYGDMTPGKVKYYDAVAKVSSESKKPDYTVLYSFCGTDHCPDGWSMPAPPIWDGKGNLFGATQYGGIGQPACWHVYGCGVVFEMTPNGDGTWTYSVIHRFLENSNTDGQTPDGELVMDTSGNLYGATVFGGSYGREKGNYGHGTVFQLSFSGGQWNKTAVYEFPNCADGCFPNGNLAFDKAGNLYGASGGGNTTCGGFYCGTIYKLSPQKNGTWQYSSVYKFNGTDGFGPLNVTMDGNGNIFGTTINGGAYNAGAAFEITP